ncbi:MAG: tellurium resistance protein TerC [Sulfurospirillaceae bacterium]|nr:tellurium resistance protein TerC [Sulfurospirillaceae bacterium]MDD2826585.1 tellurium resistance protein TerC [Sulfurospirillaceae bacterium]
MQKISGYLIFLSFIATFYSYFFNQEWVVISALPLWLSVVLLFSSLRNKNILLILIAFSVVLLLVAKINAYPINIKALASINQYLIVLLIGVGFLRLITTPKNEKITNPPKGKNAFIKTYISLHLFASVINLSALLLIADKFYQKTKKLSHLQIILLTRAFSSDAYWSPFFVAFGAAVTFTPKVNLIYVISSGLFMALVAFLLTYVEVRRDKNLLHFEGYPLHYQNLILPFSLAFCVLLTNHFFPNIKIIVLVALFCIALACIVLPIKEGIQSAIESFSHHLHAELPRMKTEISLFLIAGVFGVSASTIFQGLGFGFPFDYYDYKVAALVLFVFIILSMLGVHAIISISIFGHMLQGFDHTLVAVTFLMAWATTVSTSPFSGVNLTLQARYDVSTREVLKLNVTFLIKSYLACVLVLYLISKNLVSSI